MNAALHSNYEALNYSQWEVRASAFSKNHCFPFKNFNKVASELHSSLASTSLVSDKLARVRRGTLLTLSHLCVGLISVPPREG